MLRVAAVVVPFLLLVFGADRIFSEWLEILVLRSEHPFSQAYRGGMTADILIVGNSRADRHFPVEIVRAETGLIAANLSLGGISLESSEVLLRDFIRLNGKPKLVVVEVSNIVTSPCPVSDLRIYSARSEGIRAIDSRCDLSYAKAADVFHLLRFNNEMTFRVISSGSKGSPNRALMGVVPSEMLGRIPTTTLVNMPENIAALKRIRDFSDQLHINVLFLLTPTHPSRIARYTNLDTWKKDLCALTGDRLVDFMSEIQADRYFYDSVHLNRDGATQLVRHLAAEGFLGPIPGSRSDLGSPPGQSRGTMFLCRLPESSS